MRNMRVCLLLLGITLISFSSCSWGGLKNGDVLVEINNQTLSYDEIAKNLSLEGLSSDDSAKIVDDYIKNWVSDVLLYEEAQEHIQDLSEVNLLVENYRKSLIIYEYELHQINEHLSDKVKEDQMRLYYIENSNLFYLDEALIKGMFLILPTKSSDFDVLKTLMMHPTEENMDMIESLSVKNGAKFEYFNDRWVSFSEIQKKCPVNINSQDLLKKSNCQSGDSSYTVFFSVVDYRKPGDLQPFEYAESRIKSILIEQKKNEFLQSFKNDLYEKKKGSIKRYK